MNRIKLIFVMLAWGSIGLITKQINLSPTSLALFRSLIAVPVLYFFYTRSKDSIEMKKHDIGRYVISGIFMGFAWLALFAAFDVTNISLAVLIYNMCPVYVMIFSPVILGEKSNGMQKVTIGISFIGLFLLIGENILGNSQADFGILYALISGMLYAAIVLINRKIETSYNPSKTTLIQISAAAIILFPFALGEGGMTRIVNSTLTQVLLVVVLGIVHTGIAYTVYFSTYRYLKAVEIVSYSYLEPLFSVGLGIIILGERMTIIQAIGGILILGFTYYNEFKKSKYECNQEIIS